MFDDILDPEFFVYALAKLAASHSHINPLMQNRAMCEIFGAYGFAEGVPVMKKLLAPPEEEVKKETVKPIRRLVVKDVRIFINSVDKALRLIKDSGISVDANKTESDSVIEYTIKVPKVIA